MITNKHDPTIINNKKYKKMTEKRNRMLLEWILSGIQYVIV